MKYFIKITDEGEDGHGRDRIIEVVVPEGDHAFIGLLEEGKSDEDTLVGIDLRYDEASVTLGHWEGDEWTEDFSIDGSPRSLVTAARELWDDIEGRIQAHAEALSDDEWGNFAEENDLNEAELEEIVTKMRKEKGRPSHV